MNKIIIDFPTKKAEKDLLTNNEPYYGDADFDVDKSPLMYIDSEGNARQSSMNCFYRTDNGDQLGIHAKNYSDIKQLSYKKMIDNQREIFHAADLNTEDIEEKITVGGNGRKCFVTHVLPNEKLITPSQDEACLSFLAASSLDGTLPFVMSTGARQNACLNGQLFISQAAMLYKNKHNKLLDIDHAARLIHKGVEVFKHEVDKWFLWSDIGIGYKEALISMATLADHEETIEFIETLNSSNKYIYEDVKQAINSKDLKTNKAFKYMFDKWVNHYSKRFRSTQWALFNTFTDWSTHAPVQSESNVSGVRHNRNENIVKFVRKTFQEAA